MDILLQSHVASLRFNAGFSKELDKLVNNIYPFLLLINDS